MAYKAGTYQIGWTHYDSLGEIFWRGELNYEQDPDTGALSLVRDENFEAAVQALEKLQIAEIVSAPGFKLNGGRVDE